MKNYFLAAIIGLVAILTLSAQASWAWEYSLSGSQVCNATTGNYDITWATDNTTNKTEDFTVTSSNRPVVSVGDVVTKGTARDFTENLPGTTSVPVTVTLDIAGGWPSDLGPHQNEATVTIEETCLSPNPTPGCEGNDCVTPTPTPTTTPSNPGGPGDGKSDNLGCSVNDCSNHPSAPQVLGASTQAVLGLSTTSGEENFLPQLIQLFGALTSGGLGLVFFKKNA